MDHSKDRPTNAMGNKQHERRLICQGCDAPISHAYWIEDEDSSMAVCHECKVKHDMKQVKDIAIESLRRDMMILSIATLIIWVCMIVVTWRVRGGL